MTFWLAALAMAAAVAALLVRALWHGRGVAPPDAASDVGVYRDQLKEVDRDLARGVLTDGEAERVRLEVSRRLLEADRRGAASSKAGAPRAVTLAVAAATVALIIGGGAALYARLGAPGYPDLPIADRIAESDAARASRPGQEMAEAEAAVERPQVQPDSRHAELMAQLRQALEERPDDLRGYQLLVRNEALMGDFAAAYEAQERVIELKGPRAEASDWANLADLMITAAGGYVSPEAEEALAEALRRDPTEGTARYYSGLLYAQTGRPDLAFRLWRPLAEQGPADAPWAQAARARIGEAARLAGVNYAGPASRGPSAADFAAASDMNPEERQRMIRGMVEGLSQRLSDEGGPAEDWARLITALGVLGESERAAAIYAEAQQAFDNQDRALALIEGAAAEAGLTQ